VQDYATSLAPSKIANFSTCRQPNNPGRQIHSRNASIASANAIHQLPNGRNKPVLVERIGGKSISVMSGKHQIAVNDAIVSDRLQGFLNAKGAGIGWFAGSP